MKIKKLVNTQLGSEDLHINLSESGAGDVVPVELIFMADAAVSIENEFGTQKVINVSTLNVEEYNEGWAIIPCEGLDEIIVSGDAGTKITYKVLV